MDLTTNDNKNTLKTLAWQILTVAPIFKKRLFRPEIVQAQHPIPLSYIQVLAALNESDTLSVSEISRRFDIAKPNITPLIDRMIDAGYVKRTRNSSDRRVVHVLILEKGREKINEIIDALSESIGSWSENITPEDLVRLSHAIDEIQSILGTTV